jgi:nucleoside-diphosphate-sugar epimerase
MRVLVTGAGGFAGGHIARRLAEGGHDVLALTRASPVEPPADPPASRRFAVLRSALDGVPEAAALPRGIDAVVHTAATSIWHGITVERMIADNVLATQRLVRHALDTRVKAFVFCSSISAFGVISAPVVDESTPTVDPDAYGATKIIGEQLLRDVAGALPSLAVRLPAVIGRGSKRNWPSECLRKLQGGEPLSFFNPQAPFNNLVHEADLARLVASALERGLEGYDDVVVAADGRITVGEAVDTLAAATGSRSRIAPTQANRHAFLIDASKARRRFGWQPMDVRAALQRFAAENA